MLAGSVINPTLVSWVGKFYNSEQQKFLTDFRSEYSDSLCAWSTRKSIGNTRDITEAYSYVRVVLNWKIRPI